MTNRHEVVVVFGAAVRPDGSPSGALRRRIAAATEYAQDRAVIFLVTGGEGDYPPAEAVVMANMLRASGISDHDIILEDKSKTTSESVVRCTRIIRQLTAITRVMACSDAYHLPRCRLLFRLRGIKAGGIPAADGRNANSWQKWLWFHLREIPAIAKDTILVLSRP
jgi:vancomycin permeability regulator SanA